MKKLFVLLLIGISCFQIIQYAFAETKWVFQELDLFTQSSSVLPSIIPETNPPEGSVVIKYGDVYTRSSTVTLFTLAVDDTGVDSMRLRNSGESWAEQDYKTDHDWVVKPGVGLRRVEVQFIDVFGNESGIYYDEIFVDGVKPSGIIAINAGATYTKSTAVTLNLSASDGAGSGVDKMSFKKDGGSWSGWENYKATKSWTLPSTNGTRRVWVKYKDSAGNVSSAVSDTIKLDTKKPTVKISTPYLSTNQTKNTKFRVTWKGGDPSPASKIASFDVQKKVHGGGWKSWKTNTTKRAAYFGGRAGKNYYFRVRAEDRAGNVSRYSSVKRTIVPFDNNSRVKNHVRFGSRTRNTRAYKNTLRYTTKTGARITYKFRGRGVYLITTKARTRSKAKIYIDNKLIKTVNTYSARTRYRKVVFRKLWKKRGNHTIKIVNVGNRRRLDIDALGVKE